MDAAYLNHGRRTQEVPSLEILKTLFGVHADRLQQALSRTAERHRVLTSNLANINTPGYKRKDLSLPINTNPAHPLTQPFSLKATDPRHFISTSLSPNSQNNQPAEDPRALKEDGNGVDLEREIAALTETQLHYSALSLISQRYFKSLKNIIREGR
ncbi:MAG: flagellar basal body rod protein FlgB [Candidatus Caldarchaeum sp.]